MNRDIVLRFYNAKWEPHYKVLLLDMPFVDIGYWIDSSIVEEFHFLELYMGIFEGIFEDVLKKFDGFSFYDISNFSDDELLRLLETLENKINENSNLTQNEFITKYKYVYSYTEDSDNDGALFTKQEVKSSILLVIETFIIFVKKAIEENKCITIIGI